MTSATVAGDLESTDDALVGGLGSLLALLVPSLGPPADDPRAERLLQLCLRIVSSRMAGSTAAPSDSAAAEATRRRLVQAGRAADALTYTELHSRLIRAASLRRPSAALQLLTALLGSTDGTHLGAALARPPLAFAPTPRIVSPVLPSSVATNGYGQPRAEDTRANNGNPRAGGAAASGGGDPVRRRWTLSGAGELSEATLVRELLFAMQNIDGTHLKWDAARDAFVLPSGAKVPPGTRQLVGRLAELGWLFRQVATYAKAGQGAGGASAAGGGASGVGGAMAGGLENGIDSSMRASGGLVAQALRHALQGELDGWFELLAVLEEQRQSECASSVGERSPRRRCAEATSDAGAPNWVAFSRLRIRRSDRGQRIAWRMCAGSRCSKCSCGHTSQCSGYCSWLS